MLSISFSFANSYKLRFKKLKVGFGRFDIVTKINPICHFKALASDADDRNNFRQIRFFWWDLKVVYYSDVNIFLQKYIFPKHEDSTSLTISKTYFATILL